MKIKHSLCALVLSLTLLVALPLHADEKSGNLDLSNFSLAGLHVLPVEKRVKAQNFWLQTLHDREDVTLSSYRGKVLVISFWATWCPPCRAEMPAIESLYQELEKQGLAWLAINSTEDTKAIDLYIKKYGYTFPVLPDPQNSVMRQYELEALPATIIINKNAYVVALAVGSVDWRNHNIMEAFQKLLSE